MKKRWSSLICAFCMICPAIGHAGEVHRMTAQAIMDALAKIDDYQEVAVSPDGRRVAWVSATTSAEDSLPAGSSVWMAKTATLMPARRITAVASGEKIKDSAQEADVAWSADSRSLAFLSDAESPGQKQLYLTQGEGRVKQLTRLSGDIETPQWSPDGRRIAILFTRDAERRAGPTEAAAVERGIAGERIDERRLVTVDVETGGIQELSPADLYLYQYDWSADGRRIVATAAHGDGDNNWYTAELVIIDSVSGITRSIFKPERQIAAPRWSPDGKFIAFIGGLNSDEGVASGDVYCISALGGNARNLTPDLKASAYWLAWYRRSNELIVVEAINGASGIARVGMDGAVKQVWTGPVTVRGPAGFALGISLSRDGSTSAVIRRSHSIPPQLAVGHVGEWRVVTPSPVKVDSFWGKEVGVVWRSEEFDVQGWLLYPPNYDPRRKYPLVVWVHGGPASVTIPAWPAGRFFPDALLASQGYFVFYPNPRGSSGFGERFKRANVKDLGGGDLRDILAGIRRVVAMYPVDSSRIGIGGWSYGGDMTMWALTQTTQFRAAFAGAGTADLLSYYGENDFNAWLLPYFGASLYEDPAVYAKSSPINFIRNVRTPTLLAVGDSDVESPALQSREYWNALKALHVRTSLVIYPHEGHALRDPANVRDLMIRIVDWFDQNMPEPVD